jgi:hypothetical protein
MRYLVMARSSWRLVIVSPPRNPLLRQLYFASGEEEIVQISLLKYEHHLT